MNRLISIPIINLIRSNTTFDITKISLLTALKPQLENKQLITLSPGGYYGFYDLGTCLFIKKNYNLDKYVFSGASAGSWNSLLLSYKYDSEKLSKNILDLNLNKTSSLKEIQAKLKSHMLSIYTDKDFDLDKVFIGVTVSDKFKFKTNVYSDFHNLTDAINCCMASSHIPFITGDMTYIYQNKYSLDGGFISQNYGLKPKLHIHNEMWFSRNKGIFSDVTKMDVNKLFEQGYSDASKNKNFFDNIFN